MRSQNRRHAWKAEGGDVLVWECLSSGERQKKKLEPDLNRPDYLFQNRVGQTLSRGKGVPGARKGSSQWGVRILLAPIRG